MQKWQKENKEQRSVICVATSEDNIAAILQGAHTAVLGSLVQVTDTDSDWKTLFKAVHEAIENPIDKLLVYAKWEEYKREHGIKNCDDNKSESDTSADTLEKDFIKELIETIIGKL